MKDLFAFLVAIVVGGPGFAQEPARVTIYCTSLLFEAASGGPGGAITLRLTTDPAFSEINGEVAPFFEPGLPSHGALFLLEDPTFPDTLSGRIAFDTPMPVDRNGDGFDDFFQVNQAVEPTTTQGLFETVVENGAVSATWSRAAGASSGTCRLELTGEVFGELPAFVHTYQLLEYTGTLAYSRDTNSLTGTMQLVQTQNPSETLFGTVSAIRVETNRFDWIDVRAGTLTNASGETLTHQLVELERDEFSKTNYFGFLDLTDGNPATGTVDFWSWVMSIDDPNDEDGDGIPDFSDDLLDLPQVRSTLAVAQQNTQLLLTVRGQTGRSYEIEETASLSPPAWATAMSVTLTNETQVIELARPETSPRFWRARER